MAEYLNVLDISGYQPTVDYAKTAKACEAVILRCGGTGYGSTHTQYTDSCFEKHYNGFRAQGAKIGAYFYAGAIDEAGVKKEIELCLSQFKGKTFELPIFYDVEAPGEYRTLSAKEKARLAKIWCEGIEKACYKAGIYTYLDYAKNYFDVTGLTAYPFWLAQYNSKLTWSGRAVDLWQYTDSGKVDGISGKVDLSKVLTDNIFIASVEKKEEPKTTQTEKQTKPQEGYEVTVNTLKNGSKGNAVRSLQFILIGNGYNCGGFGADGKYGAGTKASVRAWQKAHGLSVDGIVGPKTWASLFS